GLVVAGGLGKLSGRIVRIGHLGWVSEEEIDRALGALGKAVEKVREN
ncbi:MAG: alanine--glyoxylate aminotransferase family protein, partial [Chloroflexi bacterium]|nr:alanine--glyoxylate aminotransferase family protein [Chloroflexota bacterium]